MPSTRVIKRYLGLMVCLNLVVLPQLVGAQSYPTKPIRMIVPSSPGGGTDLTARPVARKLSESWGQQVIVDNRPGAGTIIGTDMAAHAPPDGYTILVAPSSITTLALYKTLNFDLIKDFIPVSLIISAPQLLVVHPSLPVKSVKELIALAKVKPGQLNYASPGSGSLPELTFELFKNIAGIDVVHIPYKGTGPAITNVVGGQVQMMITGIVALMPHVTAGRLRGIAVTSASRADKLPDLPTFLESGVPKFDASTWFGVFLPAGVPPPIVAKLNGEIRRILEMRDVRQYFIDQGADPGGNTPEQFAAYVKSEVIRWSKVAKGMKVD